MSELLPCPFCGNKEIDEYEGDYGNGVYCMTCGAMMGEQIHTCDFVYTGDRITYEQARQAWNTRAERTCRMLVYERDKNKPLIEQWGVCSECEQLIEGVDNYCPNCGAKVVEE